MSNISNKKIIINGNLFSDLDGFYDEISEKLMSDQGWKVGTLDGLDDILYGGFGVFENNEKLEIAWQSSRKSQKDLGLKTTLDFLDHKLKIGKPYNVELIKKQKEDLLHENGKTLFEIILEIFESHPNISLKLV